MKAALDGNFKPGRVSLTLLNGFTIENIRQLVGTSSGIFVTRADGTILFIPFTGFQYLTFSK